MESSCRFTWSRVSGPFWGASWNLTYDLSALPLLKEVRDAPFQLPGYRKLPVDLFGKSGMSHPVLDIRFPEGQCSPWISVVSLAHSRDGGSSMEECLHQTDLLACLWGVFLIGNRQRKIWPTVGSAIPRPVLCKRGSAAWARKQASWQCPSIPPWSPLQFLPCLPLMMNCVTCKPKHKNVSSLNLLLASILSLQHRSELEKSLRYWENYARIAPEWGEAPGKLHL